jgi:hypothetical protein
MPTCDCCDCDSEELNDNNICEVCVEEEREYGGDDWGDDEYDYINNEDSIISFLNEYYVVYPKKLPKPVFK